MKKYVLTGLLLLSVLSLIFAQKIEPLINSTLNGRVLDRKSNLPLSGADIQIKGTTHEVVADNEGRFNFRTGQKFPYILIVSHVGYETQEVTVTSNTIEIQLKETSKGLEEVVVVGYGTSKRKNLVGAVTKVNASELRDIPAGGFDAQLQGKAAGLQTTTTTGVPGESVTVRLRGATSINADNTPLYVIDGVFVNSTSLQTVSTGGKSTSPIADINPADIESVEVLKDAEASALYGSRGANGVIIVTTKRGNFSDGTRINAQASHGYAWAPPLWKLTTGPEHATLVNEYYANIGGKQPFTGDVWNPAASSARGTPELQKTYDRLGEAFHTANLSSYNLSVASGNKATRFYLGAGYDNQESILRPISFDRATFKFNIDHKISSIVQIGSSNTLTRTHRNQGRAGDGPAGGILQAALHTPTYLPPTNDQGVLVGRAGFDNLTLLLQYYDVNAVSLRYIGNVYADVQILPDLKFRTSWGVDYDNYKESEYWNSMLIAGSPSGDATSSISDNASWVNEQTLTYRKKLGKHNFGILVGNTLQSNTYERTFLDGKGFANNSFTKISSASVITGTQNWSQNTLASFFGKVDYNFNDKYIINASLRADGSSKFGPERKWGYFPSVGAAWRVKQEKFLQDVDVISDLKLRASYGITGNQNGIGDFASQGLWTGGSSYKDTAGIAPQQLANDNLQWEKTSQFNIGADVSFFNGRLSLEANYYYKYTSNGLLQLPRPATTGFSTYWSNAAEISNKGFELTINSVNIQNKNFTWSTNFNVAQNINKIEKLASPLQYGSRNLILLQQGSPMYSFYLYKQLYVDPQTGNAIYQKADGTQGMNPKTSDKQIMGSVWPKFFGGLGNDLTFGNFDFNIFFSFQYGNKTYNHNRFFGEGGGARDAARVIFASDLARWQKPGDITDVPKADGVNVNNYLDAGGRWLEDGSFVRLRNVTLGYSFPKTFVKKIGLRNIRLYVTGSNLFLITKYSGPDPESSANSNQNQPGIDLGTPPQPRSVQFGINVGI
ncbi:SusC/RagA family TonB-linked outer membrane protein [Pinibacter soli]|uniref:TonB-dependent receptor n=1 Tax=Pinibacter soli TaxID=3044211 RepID=A0ABT6RFK1_9BACT|nr:TonB-dependent receptor [Pinibacter soli]MDI3320642.1 TonB-dependent receptor [Pinibacter soli]